MLNDNSDVGSTHDSAKPEQPPTMMEVTEAEPKRRNRVDPNFEQFELFLEELRQRGDESQRATANALHHHWFGDELLVPSHRIRVPSEILLDALHYLTRKELSVLAFVDSYYKRVIYSSHLAVVQLVPSIRISMMVGIVTVEGKSHGTIDFAVEVALDNPPPDYVRFGQASFCYSGTSSLRVKSRLALRPGLNQQPSTSRAAAAAVAAALEQEEESSSNGKKSASQVDVSQHFLTSAAITRQFDNCDLLLIYPHSLYQRYVADLLSGGRNGSKFNRCRSISLTASGVHDVATLGAHLPVLVHPTVLGCPDLRLNINGLLNPLRQITKGDEGGDGGGVGGGNDAGAGDEDRLQFGLDLLDPGRGEEEQLMALQMRMEQLEQEAEIEERVRAARQQAMQQMRRDIRAERVAVDEPPAQRARNDQMQAGVAEAGERRPADRGFEELIDLDDDVITRWLQEIRRDIGGQRRAHRPHRRHERAEQQPPAAENRRPRIELADVLGRNDDAEQGNDNVDLDLDLEEEALWHALDANRGAFDWPAADPAAADHRPPAAQQLRLLRQQQWRQQRNAPQRRDDSSSGSSGGGEEQFLGARNLIELLHHPLGNTVRRVTVNGQSGATFATTRLGPLLRERFDQAQEPSPYTITFPNIPAAQRPLAEEYGDEEEEPVINSITHEQFFHESERQQQREDGGEDVAMAGGDGGGVGGRRRPPARIPRAGLGARGNGHNDAGDGGGVGWNRNPRDYFHRLMGVLQQRYARRINGWLGFSRLLIEKEAEDEARNQCRFVF